MILLQALLITFTATWVSCTISGLNYIDSVIDKNSINTPEPGKDPCNPLYWYPKNIPDHCYNKDIANPTPKPEIVPIPVSIPLPPQSFPFPMPLPPMSPPYPMPPPYPLSPPNPMPPIPIPMPMPMFPPPMPIPYGIPFEPPYPMLPVAGIPGIPYPHPFPHYRPQPPAGMVPGLPGLVAQDGGLNILPFSDAYADVLERHKQKMIRKELEKVLDDYKDNPRMRKNGKYRRGRLF